MCIRDSFKEDMGFFDMPGVVLVQPVTTRWQFKTKIVRDGTEGALKELWMSRTQLPLAPEKPRTVETARA